MGNTHSVNKINFEALQDIINNNIKTSRFIIINTLDETSQECLIYGSLSNYREVETINEYLKQDKSINIVIYGENCCDNRVIDKYNQLFKLGFINIFVYIGGLFEWLLLQDIYGEDEFKTTSKQLDILKYKGKLQLKLKL
tara:strand:- start:552 stop:971 length:420 start_codon:yes stop_codon:yes gene_type:complete